MNLGRLSINQPILAMVLSIVLLIVGAIAYTTLPVSEYPQVVPPTVVVTTQYPGATAQTVSDTVCAVAPGYCVVTTTVGGTTCGYSDTGSVV